MEQIASHSNLHSGRERDIGTRWPRCNALTVTDDLDAALTVIRECSAKGLVADFAPKEIPDDLPSYDDDEFWAGRTVSAVALAALLTAGTQNIHHRGVRISWLRLVGDLDTEGAEFDRQIQLHHCQMGASSVRLDDARVRGVDLSQSTCGALSAPSAHINGSLLLRGLIAQSVDVSGAKIDGRLDATGAELGSAGGPALNGVSAEVAGWVFLRDGFKARGLVSFLDAKLGGLECRSGEFSNDAGDALNVERAELAGGAFLNGTFKATGRVSFNGAHIRGLLSCVSGRFLNGTGQALNVAGAEVGDSVLLNDGFKAEGLVAPRSRQDRQPRRLLRSRARKCWWSRADWCFGGGCRLGVPARWVQGPWSGVLP